MKKRWAILLALCWLLPLSVRAQEDGVYTLLSPDGRALTQYAGTPEPGDEYIAGDNQHYRVTEVDSAALTAQTQALGAYALPDVTWLEEDAQPVAAAKKAVAIYCTHSDESYVPTDGASSIERRGGIYDVAESLKKEMEKLGITVYYSAENHAPHDAGAYRRSRNTAAALAEEGVDAIFDVHRDGIPDADQYASTVKGDEITKVRLLVGRSNQNADANKQFAAQIKAVADKLYPGLVKDIYIGKGSYNQDLMSQAVLLEFGTHVSDKNDALSSTSYMANVLNRTLYGGVSGAAGKDPTGAEKNSGGWTGILWLVAALVLGALVFAFISTGSMKGALHQWKRSFQQMTGGLAGRPHDGDPKP